MKEKSIKPILLDLLLIIIGMTTMYSAIEYPFDFVGMILGFFLFYIGLIFMYSKIRLIRG